MGTIQYEIRQLNCIHRLDAERKQLRCELERAKRSIATLRATLTIERKRYQTAVEGVERLRETYRGRGPSRGAYAAIVALKRVRDADPEMAGVEPEAPMQQRHFGVPWIKHRRAR